MYKATVKAINGDSYTITSKYMSDETIRNILNIAKDEAFINIDGLVIRKGDVVSVLVAEQNEEWRSKNEPV